MSSHFDETDLQDYLDDPEAFAGRVELENHLAFCTPCRNLLEELRAFDAALASDTTWGGGAAEEDEPPAAIRALAELLSAEDADADELLAPLLASPASFKRANVPSMPLLRTAGVVRRLCAESRELRERQPMHALVVADAAIAIADQLQPQRYPEPMIDELRAAAWLERANVLRYLGRYPEALDALDVSAGAAARSPVAAYSQALVDYLRAVVFVETDRAEEALLLVRRTARVFRQFGEDERWIHAKIVEASVLFQQSRYREARDLFLSLIAPTRQTGDAETLARLYGNVANCQLQLHELESADVYFARALSLYEALGIETERIRTRWSIGCLRIATGDVEDGLARLREARREFEEIGARTDAALVTLDIAEALLASGSAAAAQEASELCTGLVESFTAVGMTGNALTALAFLREAFASGRATPVLVRHVRQYIETRPEPGDAPFIPPPHL